MRSNARTPIIAILTLLGTLLWGSSVLADDYSVDFGADTDGGRDAGTLNCRFGQRCYAKMESLKLTVSLDISHGDPARAHVGLSSDELGCCYFAYAKDRIEIDPRTTQSRMPIFKGVGARGSLFIENERAGTLYLRFHFY
jgi:hypothetical protein